MKGKDQVIINNDEEVREIVREFPSDTSERTAGGIFNKMPLNATVIFNSKLNVIEIWPHHGGYLQANCQNLLGDIAPGH